MVNSWIITLEECGEDLVLPLSDEILKAVGWQIGDTITWEKGVGESWTLKKKNKKPEYAEFDRWFNQPEAYGLRSERFYDLLNNTPDQQQRFEIAELWLLAAWLAGKEQAT
jgi:hypothetical protein